METTTNRLFKLCRKWGGDLQIMPDWPITSTEVSVAPFDSQVGVNWERKTVYAVEGAHFGSVIHEMGHVFAHKKPPKYSDEYAFFGWEYLLAKMIRASMEEWHSSMASYSVKEGDDYGALSRQERWQVIRERIQHGIKIGIITPDRKPVAIR